MTLKAAALILAAGQGTRMRSKKAKVLHKLAGIPMVEHVWRNLTQAGLAQIYLVVGYQGERVQESLPQVKSIFQEEQLGTGHAVNICQEALADFDGPVLVTYGDTPLFRAETFYGLIEEHNNQQAACTVITADAPDPTGYGRIVRDNDGDVQKIVEHKDAKANELAITEINTGTYCFDSKLLFAYLAKITPDNAQGEYYLPDVIPLLIQDGYTVKGFKIKDWQESMGVNNRVQLAQAEAIIQQRLRQHWMLAGVTMIDPPSVFLEMDCQIGEDSLLHPGVILKGNTTIGPECSIGPNARLTDCAVGMGVTLEETIAVDATIGDNVKVGPFAYLRPGTELGAHCKVGDFVEVKNSRVAQGSKIPHHSYIGDAIIGSGVNIGCGTITCNYDGKDKHTTIIEDNVFVGSNSNLVAPVTLRKGSYVAAGSTITDDVPQDSLAIARARQTVKQGWKKTEGNK